MALLVYAQDNRQVFPAVVTPDDPGQYNSTYLRPWSQILIDRDYVSAPAIFQCPGDTINTRFTGGRSYTYCNTAMSGGRTGTPPVPTNLARVDAPSRQYMLTEWHDTGNAYYLSSWSGAFENIISPASVSPSHSDGGRHFVFMDGHVEWRTLAKAAEKYGGWVLNDIRS